MLLKPPIDVIQLIGVISLGNIGSLSGDGGLRLEDGRLSGFLVWPSSHTQSLEPVPEAIEFREDVLDVLRVVGTSLGFWLQGFDILFEGIHQTLLASQLLLKLGQFLVEVGYLFALLLQGVVHHQ
jgi:hypothetical protein